MAEAVGLTFALLGAFNDAVECFAYVQVARSFDQDFQTAILKLDIVKLRLSGWGRSVGLDRVENGMQTLPAVAGSSADIEKAEELLQQIVELFEEAERSTIKLKTPPKDNGGL